MKTLVKINGQVLVKDIDSIDIQAERAGGHNSNYKRTRQALSYGAKEFNKLFTK